jgi:hypothetical protein
LGVQEIVFRSRFGRVLTALVAALLAGALAVVVVADGVIAALTALPALLAMLALTWVTFWQPRVEVSDAGVKLINVFTDVSVPWAEIARIDTKYALTLYTTRASYSAWGAPAPGRHSVFRASREEGSYLPESTYLSGTVRPGDLTTSDSGAAAAVVRREWERRRDSGELSQGSEAAAKSISWPRVALIAAALTLAALISF